MFTAMLLASTVAYLLLDRFTSHAMALGVVLMLDSIVLMAT